MQPLSVAAAGRAITCACVGSMISAPDVLTVEFLILTDINMDELLASPCLARASTTYAANGLERR